MNLASTISLYGGGPGSGCQGPNCGRPATGRQEWSPELKVQTWQFYQDRNGHYLPERLVEHDKAVVKYQNRPSQKHPVLKLIAGGMASGKTTVEKGEYATLRSPSLVNSDLPRADLPEYQKVIGTGNAGLLQGEAGDIRDKVLMSALAHNNDIAMQAAGSPNLARKLDALEKAGYRIAISYIHTPLQDSIMAAQHRLETTTDPADKRKVSPEEIRESHDKARGALQLLLKPGREVKIYGPFGRQLIYHRGADGTVHVKNDAALKEMRNARGEKQIPDIF